MKHRPTTAFHIANHHKRNWQFSIDDPTEISWRVGQSFSWGMADIDSFLNQAKESDPLLQNTGKDLADRLGGEFILGPLKKRERVEQVLGKDESPSTITDYVRGCILLENSHEVIRARKKIREWTDTYKTPILQSIDRYSRPTAIGLRGIFLYVELPNGHIGEIQVHLKSYWDELQKTHPLYSRARDMLEKKTRYSNARVDLFMACVKGEDFEPPKEWTDEDQREFKKVRKNRKFELAHIAEITHVNSLLLESKNFVGDCSYPVRPTVNSQNGQLGFLIAQP